MHVHIAIFAEEIVLIPYEYMMNGWNNVVVTHNYKINHKSSVSPQTSPESLVWSHCITRVATEYVKKSEHASTMPIVSLSVHSHWGVSCRTQNLKEWFEGVWLKNDIDIEKRGETKVFGSNNHCLHFII